MSRAPCQANLLSEANPSYLAILFDLDGTILDSMPYWVKVDEIYLREENVPLSALPPDFEDKMKTLRFSEAGRFLAETFSLRRTPEEVCQRIQELMEEQYRSVIPFKPGILDFLKQERARGIEMAVVTATQYDLAETALERLGAAEYFRFIVTCDSYGGGKEDPGVYLHAAERLGFPPERIAVFEDALHCVRTAKSAGFQVVGVSDASALDDKEEIYSLCDRYIESYEELMIPQP